MSCAPIENIAAHGLIQLGLATDRINHHFTQHKVDSELSDGKAPEKKKKRVVHTFDGSTSKRIISRHSRPRFFADDHDVPTATTHATQILMGGRSKKIPVKGAVKKEKGLAGIIVGDVSSDSSSDSDYNLCIDLPEEPRDERKHYSNSRKILPHGNSRLKRLLEQNEKLDRKLELLYKENEEIRQQLRESEKSLEAYKKSAEDEKEKLRRELDNKNIQLIQLEMDLKKKETKLQSFVVCVNTAIHALNQPLQEKSIFNVLEEMKTEPEDKKHIVIDDVTQKKASSIVDESEASISNTTKHKITDRQNRRWTHDENLIVLKYLLGTLKSGSKIEKPNAPKYYTKMIEECNLSPEITHNLLRNKVQNFRRAFEKSKRDKTECSYREYLEQIWGDEDS